MRMVRPFFVSNSGRRPLFFVGLQAPLME